MSGSTTSKDKNVKSKRTFPLRNTILLIIIIALQIGVIIFGVSFQAVPKDLIHRYNVTVEPLDDGSLDIEYELVWEALDPSEELTWVEIGMPNRYFTVYPESVSSNIASYSKYDDDGYVTLQLDFKEAYIGGDVIEFSFKVNQKDMLCKNSSGYFYEFVPGWFNSIRVEQYKFTWRFDDRDDYVKRGGLDYGEYRRIFVQYDADDFEGCRAVKNYEFDGSGAYNGLESEKTTVRLLCAAAVVLMLITEIYIIDSYVSYINGRGFMTGYGHPVHIHGRSNPRYIKARDKHMASSRSGSRSGGCACACACACAGGGRAGCSQKDTFGTRKSSDKNAVGSEI